MKIRNLIFEEGDEVHYEHAVYGPGKGIIATYIPKTDEFVVYPNKTIKGIDYIVCKSQDLISTPF